VGEVLVSIRTLQDGGGFRPLTPSTPPPEKRREVNPLTNIIITAPDDQIEGKKNRRSYYNVVTTPHAKNPGTEPVSIRIPSWIIGGFRQWVKFSGLSLGEATGKAMIDFMQNNPLAQVKLNVTQDLRAALSAVTDIENIQAELDNEEHSSKLREIIDSFRRFQSENVKGSRSEALRIRQDLLRKAVRKAAKTRRPDAELIELIKEARDLL
jgi:hypothetical protein